MTEKVELHALDMTRSFLPEALSGSGPIRSLDELDRRRLNQIRACSYLHLFDVLERALVTTARNRARHDVDVRETIAPLLRLDAFDHHDLFHSFAAEIALSLEARPLLIPEPKDFVSALEHVSPLTLLVVALHFKLVTQQHYLACVRGDEALEPHFVRLLKEHWNVECGQPGEAKASGPVLPIQQALARATPGRVPPALRDYRIVVFSCDDVLGRQAKLDVETLEAVRGHLLDDGDRAAVLAAEIAAHRKTFLTVGIVNAAFVYAMKSLGPTAPSMLAGVVSALAARA